MQRRCEIVCLGLLFITGLLPVTAWPQAAPPATKPSDAAEQFRLGDRYFWGQGVPQDYKEAFKWWLRAAEHGHAQAQAQLGVLYANGQGVPQNYVEAAKWTRRAAEQAYPEAQYYLGVFYS
ncbi:MAG: sel1 repeat family protein, partial [Acidobacteria bacterium]|nr:sel1 repeat family protein [Acidobacteriota bacterium]